MITLDCRKFADTPMVEIEASGAETFPKLMLCPHCGNPTDSNYAGKHFFVLNDKTKENFFVLGMKCKICKNVFVAEYVIKNRKVEFINSFPPLKDKQVVIDKVLFECSPRFASLYQQSSKCYAQGLTDLAAMGFRSALECLIKDFAIKYTNAPENRVAKMSLSDVIIEFLDEKSIVNSADMVRLLGNDYTHFKRKYEEYDVETLKE